MGKQISLCRLSEEMKRNKRKICSDQSNLESFNGEKGKKKEKKKAIPEEENKSII